MPNYERSCRTKCSRLSISPKTAGTVWSLIACAAFLARRRWAGIAFWLDAWSCSFAGEQSIRDVISISRKTSGHGPDVEFTSRSRLPGSCMIFAETSKR